jgi:two-component system, OmpR family, phosphate regulon sensor histidine kinase PhoR
LQKVIRLSLFLMNKKIIWIVSVCMGLAMTALILVQAFWLKNAWLVKEKQFNQLIYSSMIDIERQIERHEATDLIVRENERQTRDSSVFSLTVPGSVGGPANQAGNKKSDKNVKIDPDKKKQMVDWIKNRREFVNRVIAGMFYKSAEIEKRISPQVLDQIIHDVIKTNGIDLHYEYAVIRYNNEIAYSSQNFSPAEEADYYTVQLFPEDVIANSNSLAIYFPSKQNFLFRSLSYLAISSLLLTLAIVASFGVTIIVILRQKRLSEIRNDFVSNMTHELKTPISTISLASQMLGDKSIPPEIKNTEQISKIIAEECRRLGNQVEKVLQTAVFDKGKLRLRLVEVDMHEVISSVIENFSIQVKSRNGKIAAGLNAENFILHIDQVHITNVLSNLLDNAIKYCNRDPEIYIETSNRGEFLLILVRDNGIGISKADQKRVFEKFYRVPTGNVHTVKGFGLGLSYVKMIIEEHQGYVDLDSELYTGSTFKIYLPLGDHGEHTKDKNSAG